MFLNCAIRTMTIFRNRLRTNRTIVFEMYDIRVLLKITRIWLFIRFGDLVNIINFKIVFNLSLDVFLPFWKRRLMFNVEHINRQFFTKYFPIAYGITIYYFFLENYVLKLILLYMVSSFQSFGYRNIHNFGRYFR